MSIKICSRLLLTAMVATSVPIASMAGNPLPEQIAQIRSGETDAKQSCDHLIHFDTLKFDPCINKLAKNSKQSPYAQLGIFYSGFVSALNYAHSGLPGARQSAWRFLDSANKLQNQLGINAYTLCETLPGNCKIRVATSEEMLRSGPPKPARVPNNFDSHQH